MPLWGAGLGLGSCSEYGTWPLQAPLPSVKLLIITEQLHQPLPSGLPLVQVLLSKKSKHGAAESAVV